MKRYLIIGLVLCLVAIPLTVFAQTVFTGDSGYDFDPYDDYGAMLDDGTSDAYDSFYGLALGETAGAMADYEGDSSHVQDGRTHIFPALTIDGLDVSRKFYVPATDSFADADWGRYLDCITNPGGSAVTRKVAIGGLNDWDIWDFDEDVYGDLGSDSDTIVTGSSDGDTTFETTDTWFSSDDDDDGSGDPSLGHVMQGQGGQYSVSAIDNLDSNDDVFTWIFEGVTINPGQTVCFLTFAVQADNDAAARSAATDLADLQEGTLVDLTEAELDKVVNFNIAAARAIPTLSEWGLLAFIGLLGSYAAWRMRKR